MAEQIFYSTYARYVIGKWITLVAMIREFALEKPISNLKDLEWQLVTQNQIKEAIYRAPNLVRISFDLIAAFQKTQKIINQKYDLINEQVTLVTNTVQQALGNLNIPPPLPMEELEKHLKSLQTQKNILESLMKKTEELAPNLDNLIKEYETEWEKIQKLYGEKAVQKLEKSLNIKFSDIEKAELLAPTKTKTELLAALKKYQIESLIQKI